MLSEDQIRETFEILGIPLSRVTEGSPIYITCPYADKHTPPTGNKNTRLYFDEQPHIHCFHAHAGGELRELNYSLRVAVTGSAEYQGPPRIHITSPENAERVRQVEAGRPKIIEKFGRRARTLERIEMTPAEFLSRMSLFKSEDTLWCGVPTDSGAGWAAKHFKTLAKWQKIGISKTWCYTTGCSFVPKTFSRSDANVVARKYLILESDVLSHDETRAVIEWVVHVFELPLRAIVFSGHKSLHSWFDYPGDIWVQENGNDLIAAGFCRSTLNKLSQPIRLGGAINQKTGHLQEVLYLCPSM
jgi:hypothetical protein